MSREVPEGWSESQIDAVADINPDSLRSNTSADFRLKYIDVATVDGPSIMLEPRSMSFGEAPSRARKKVKRGDILVSTVRPYLRSFCKVLSNEPNLVASTAFAVLRPKPSVDGDFLYQHVLGERFVEHLRPRMKGSNYPAVTAADVGAYPFLLPPLHEQRRIVEILSSVDQAIAATRAVIEQTRKVKQGVLECLLTNGIGHTRFKQTEIGEIPEGWKVTSLVDAGVRILDGDRGKEYPKAEDYLDDGYCLFLSAKNVTRAGFVFDDCQFISEEKHRKLRNGLLQRSDTVVTTRGTIGNFAFYGPDIEFDCMRINSGMAVMRALGSTINPDFLFALAASKLIDDQLKRRVFGSAQPQLTLDILRKLVVPVPPSEEQASIAAKAKDLLEIEKKQRKELTAIEQFKSALVSDLLTGRKRVTDALPMAAE